MEKFFWIIVGAGVVFGISLLSGADAKLEEIDLATRIRIYCHTPGHNETHCHRKTEKGFPEKNAIDAY